MEKNNQNIQLAAYYLWENNGRPEGRSEEFWFEAVKQINGKSCTKKCTCKSAPAKKSTTSSSSKKKVTLK